MSKPMLEYHYVYIYPDGSSHNSYSLHPVGTPFSKVLDYFTPCSSVGSLGSKLIPLRLRWPSYAWPGGHEIHYIVKDGGVLCYQCANEHLDRTLDEDDDEFFVVAQEINYEDSTLHCDHCGRDIQPAYGDDDE